MSEDSTFQWLVRSGRIGLWIEEGVRIALEVAPEGEPCCVLTRDDALEIARILLDLGRAVWQRTREARAGPPGVRVVDDRYTWDVAGGTLQLFAVAGGTDVGFALRGSTRCSLTATEVSEVVQVLERVLAQA